MKKIRGESPCVHLVGGICEMLSDDTVKQPCIEGPCVFTDNTVIPTLPMIIDALLQTVTIAKAIKNGEYTVQEADAEFSSQILDNDTKNGIDHLKDIPQEVRESIRNYQIQHKRTGRSGISPEEVKTMLTKSSESEETLLMCGRDFESRPDGAYTEDDNKRVILHAWKGEKHDVYQNSAR